MGCGSSQIIATSLCAVSTTTAIPTTLIDLIAAKKCPPGPARSSAFSTILYVYPRYCELRIAVQNRYGKNLLRTNHIAENTSKACAEFELETCKGAKSVRPTC
jgi:hypothetical protein